MIEYNEGPVHLKFNTVEELIQYKNACRPSAAPPPPPPPDADLPQRGRMALVAYEFVESLNGMPMGNSACAQLVREWEKRGIVTTAPSKRLNEATGRRRKHPAGIAYSPNTARPWLLAVERAIAANLSKGAFVVRATAPGSKVGSSISWKP